MKEKRVIIVICDSLRRDLVTPETAPLLTAFASQSTWFSQARGVFPSTTRVSSATIATGCLPARHGLLGNCMLLPVGDGLKNHSVGHPDFRAQMRAATGHTLRVPTLAERTADYGGAAIYSNVSPGAAYFSDPDAHGHVFHRAGSYGPGHASAPALAITSGAAGDAEMTTAFCAMLLGTRPPAVATLWLSEPDHSGHAHALGSPRHLQAIGHAERCVAHVLDTVATLRARGEDILLMVGSDHGMESVVGEIDVGSSLVHAGLKEAADSTEVVVAPNGTAFIVGVTARAASRIASIVAFLHEQPWCGSVFQGDALADIGMPINDPACAIAGTFSATDSCNPQGVRGLSWIAADPAEKKSYTGFGQHGGLGKHEQAPFLIVQGGRFAPGTCSHPVSLIDYAPTVLSHLGLPLDGMDGHPLPFSNSPCQD